MPKTSNITIHGDAMSLKILTLACAVLISLAPPLYANMLITYRAQESDTDKRYNYDTALLEFALKKTEATHGPYSLRPSPVMNYSRTKSTLMTNRYKNFFAKLSYDDRFKETMDMDFVQFPVDLGIVGYRVFFLSRQTKNELTDVKTLDMLKTYTIGQGSGWSDVEILRAAGFKVIEVPTYESLFKMVALNRFDLLSRGANEVLDEYESHEQIKDFAFDTHICLAYPLPRFFYTHSANQRAIERITAGLKLGYADRSVQKLWQKHYQKSIDFVKLNKRKIFRISNPNIKNLDFDFQQYFYTPENADSPIPTP